MSELCRRMGIRPSSSKSGVRRLGVHRYDREVTSETETILREALALRDQERAALVVELLASLEPPATDDPATVEALWAEELQRRAARIDSGQASTEPWSVVRERALSQLKE